MIVYRFTRKKYSNDLSGEGSRLYGGRWNSKGIPVVYTSTSVSLALLELLIHSASYEEIDTNVLMQVKVPENSIQTIAVQSLKTGWQKDIDYCQNIGNAFLASGKTLLLRVPSAIIADEQNILINPRHPESKKIKILSAEKFRFDSRMFKI